MNALKAAYEAEVCRCFAQYVDNIVLGRADARINFNSGLDMAWDAYQHALNYLKSQGRLDEAGPKC